MSWTDVYPVFAEEQIDDYHESATASEKERLEDWYGIEQIINARPEKVEIISVSLFWKSVHVGEAPLPTPTREILQNAVDLGLPSDLSQLRATSDSGSHLAKLWL